MTPEVLATCFAVATAWPPEPALGDPAASPCLVALFDFAGRLAFVTPDPGIARQFDIPRARAELGLTGGPGLTARLAVEAIRTVPEEGYIGIDGESYVPRLQIAEARFTHAPWGLWIAAGLVDEVWIPRGEREWGWRPVAPLIVQTQGLLARSDLGGTLGWTGPDRVASVSLSLTTGEGLNQRERNDGKNLTVVVALRPLALLDPAWADRLVVEGYVREGSKGFESARDHRFAARVSGGVDAVQGGFEWIHAVGVGGDPARTPTALSTWVRTDPWGPLTAFARFDYTHWIPGEADSDATTLWLGAGTRLPFVRKGPGNLLIGWQRRRSEDQAAPVAGATAPVNDDTLFLQLGVFLRGGLSLAPRPEGP